MSGAFFIKKYRRKSAKKLQKIVNRPNRAFHSYLKRYTIKAVISLLKRRNEKKMTLKELRKERRMTQSEVGEVIGTDDRTYRKYENGEVKLSGIRLQILADFFGVPANEIDLKVRKE